MDWLEIKRETLDLVLARIICQEAGMIIGNQTFTEQRTNTVQSVWTQRTGWQNREHYATHARLCQRLPAKIYAGRLQKVVGQPIILFCPFVFKANIMVITMID